MNRKRQIYMIIEKSELELPILVGTNKELCTFLNLTQKGVEYAISKKSIVGNKYFIIKIDGYKDVNFEEFENEEFKEQRFNTEEVYYPSPKF